MLRSRFRSRTVALVVLCAATLAAPRATDTARGAAATPSSGSAADRPARVATPRRATSLRAPPAFVEATGTLGPGVAFAASGAGRTLLLTDAGMTWTVRPPDRGPGRHGVAFDVVGADPASRWEGADPLPGRVTRIRPPGGVSACGARTFRAAVRRGVLPGIDLRLDVAGGAVKATWTVHPGGDVRAIRLAVRGADGVRVDAAGALVVATRCGEVVDPRPVAWQDADGARVAVAVRHVLDGTTAAFEVAAFDAARDLVIDPDVPVFATLLGGEGGDVVEGVAVHGDGSVYAAGWTESPETSFPVTPGYQATYGGNRDAFVAKFGADGALVYVTYVGGAAPEEAHGIAVGQSGSAYVTGTAVPSAFPQVGGGPVSTLGGDAPFAFRLNPAGDALVWSSFVPASAPGVHGLALAEDPIGNVVVAGDVESGALAPAVGPSLVSAGGSHEGFVARIARTGDTWTWAGYVGGSGDDRVTHVALGPDGAAYVAGRTGSPTTFPLIRGPSATPGPGTDSGFVARVAADGSGLDWSGFTPHPVGGLAVDDAGRTWVAWSDGADATLARIDAPEDGFAVRTQIAGTSAVCGVALAPQGFPVVAGISGATGNVLVARFDADGAAIGPHHEIDGVADCRGVAVGADGAAALGGGHASPTFPALHAAQADYGGGWADGWVASLAQDDLPAPDQFAAEFADAYTVRLRWRGTTDPGVTFELLRSTGGGAFASIGSVPSGTFGFQDGGLAADTGYTYRIRAVSEAGPSPLWSSVTVRTPQTLDVRRVRGRLVDAPDPGGDSYTATARVRANAAAVAQRPDPSVRGITVRFGSAAGPDVLVVGPLDPRWRVRGRWRRTWTDGAHALRLDLRRQRFRITARWIDFPAPPENPLVLHVRMGDDAGSAEFAWAPRRRR